MRFLALVTASLILLPAVAGAQSFGKNPPASQDSYAQAQAQGIIDSTRTQAEALTRTAGTQPAAAPKPGTAGASTGLFSSTASGPAPLTQAQLAEQMKDKDSPEYKAYKLADEAKANISLFGMMPKDDEVQNVTNDTETPPELDNLRNVHAAHGVSYGISDDMLTEQMALDMRRDAMREAALSYGARGGLAKRAYQIEERMKDYSGVLNKVFDFRQLLIKAPSGMMIEPPIVNEAIDAMIIESDGNEAAVADQVLKINKQAKIVAAPRDWRQYVVISYATEIPPPPRVLWPKNIDEQAEWNTWIKQGWDAGYTQGEEMFESGLQQLVADYNGMVRYRLLLAQGKVSQPFAMQEDRGVTGGGDEMRVGDRALKITGQSQFLTGANLWKPADR